jgi:hypothetical protein
LLKFKYPCGHLKITGTCYLYSAGLHECMADKQVEQRTSTFTTQGPTANSTENRLTSRWQILWRKFLRENITLDVIHMHVAFKSLALILLNMNPSIIPYSPNISLHNCGAILLYSRAFTNMPDIWETWSSFDFAVSHTSNTRQVWIQSTWIFYPKNPQSVHLYKKCDEIILHSVIYLAIIRLRVQRPEVISGSLSHSSICWLQAGEDSP